MSEVTLPELEPCYERSPYKLVFVLDGDFLDCYWCSSNDYFEQNIIGYKGSLSASREARDTDSVDGLED